MPTFGPEQPDAAIDAILRASRPAPDPEWVSELERRLLTPRRRPRFAPLFRPFSFALAGGLALVAVTFSLAGVGPLAHNAAPVEAHDSCHMVAVVRTERVPFVVTDAEGRATIIYRAQSVSRRVQRCAPPRGAAGRGRER